MVRVLASFMVQAFVEMPEDYYEYYDGLHGPEHYIRRNIEDYTDEIIKRVRIGAAEGDAIRVEEVIWPD